ncbi:hypothetical protein Flav3CDRAFT_0459 [Flavobacteria bacterium MS024-3C]|jgi:LytS/YehU family sensor histidine kinase|nr:hypothetical protein Flav3CDRAFT_0459 [Flavobacteria bacterium MS024-3C]MDA9273776.1 hypothetical protein [Flavobacteriaceae bacterium]
MEYILVSIFLGFITGAIGRYIAKEKNRSPLEGFWFGFLLSLFGVLIVALLPNKKINSTTDKLDVKPNYENLIPKLDILFVVMVLLFI